MKDIKVSERVGQISRLRQSRRGGFIRDSNGNWVRGFSRAIGTSLILLSELWALRNGLFMAKFLRIEKLIVNVNAGI